MSKLYKKSLLAALALTFAIPASLSITTTSQAANKDVIIGAIIGGVVGKSIASSKYKHHHTKKHKTYHQPKHKSVNYKRAHVNWCFDNYRTYDVHSNTFKDYDGYTKSCYSPYS